MSWTRPLGSTGLQVSALGLGTVKLGRTEGLKYPGTFTLPDERSARELLALARSLGINLLDTAPAYGSSEERLGELLAGQRRDWILCTKVGEEFAGGQSRFDFSPEAARQSVLRSLRRLATDVLDIVLVHSDGDDLRIMAELGTLQALRQLQQQGLVRAYGISTKTVAGGLAAAAQCDVVMATYNLRQRDEVAVLDACARRGVGALVKKPLDSGKLTAETPARLRESLALVMAHPGASSAVIGTVSPIHLRANVECVRDLLD
jgi:aryl-alcohol dehydrogenase-like predicted oxidoreductase